MFYLFTFGNIADTDHVKLAIVEHQRGNTYLAVEQLLIPSYKLLLEKLWAVFNRSGEFALKGLHSHRRQQHLQAVLHKLRLMETKQFHGTSVAIGDYISIQQQNSIMGEL